VVDGRPSFRPAPGAIDLIGAGHVPSLAMKHQIRSLLDKIVL
jgi:hypothetical protein